MTTGGKRVRGIVLFVDARPVLRWACTLLANALIAPWVKAGIAPDKPTLVLVTGTGFLFWTVMLSQALESVTRAYYARSDLDLILSFPRLVAPASSPCAPPPPPSAPCCSPACSPAR